MKKQLYIITGANGHLGNTIIRMLAKQDCAVRGLILPGETASSYDNVTYIEGDVRNKESLLPLFDNTEGMNVIFIHTAGIVDISGNETPLLYDVNVNGTKTVAELCLARKVRRLVYVSSVHAIPEKGDFDVLREVNRFSPDEVVGGYAKTKAEATQTVLDMVKSGLDAVVVHPSGIIGPYDSAGNHLVQLLRDYLMGKLPACVKGGYDFVDVRDVAVGCLLAAEKGGKGECYILSNRHYEIKDVLAMAKKIYGGRKLPVLPMWMARAAAPVMDWFAKIKKIRPLYTKYSLHTLAGNDQFSHDKATSELGYRPRDLYQTVADTIAWLCNCGNKKLVPQT